MATTKKKTSTRQTKKDLEDKIAELEKKLSNLSAQIETKPAAKPAPKPAETKPAEPAKPAEAAKPAETKPAETKPAEPTPAKEKGSLPKGFEQPAQAEQTAPEPAGDNAPATINAALEHAYQNAAMTDFHQYRAKVTGYTPAANRYFVRRTAPVGKVTTTNWHEQKAKVTGYTQPSNQYFATRARLAYHPPEKTFTGYDMKVDGAPPETEAQQAPPPTEAPKPKGTLPKGMEQPAAQQAPPPQQTQTTQASSEGKSRQEQLEDYEKDYLQRLEQQKAEAAAAAAEAAAAEAQAKASQTRGTLPKGFEPPAPAEEAPKQQRGTLPKGF